MQQASWHYNLVSLAGLFAICFLAWISGRNRRQVRWSTMAWGLSLQLVMGILVFLLPAGRGVLLWINDLVVDLLDSARAGINFIFGPLALGPGQTGPGGVKSLGFILGIQSLPTVIFFMALSALLYQAGILQRVVKLFARIFLRTLGTSGAESLGAASTIFVGVETAGMVRPYLKDLTRSEFFCLLTACMATVASTVLGVYVLMLKDQFPNIAGHLVSASIISAPAAIVVAKLMEPETGEPLTARRTVEPGLGRHDGFIEAAIQGSLDGVRLLVGIVALLISFLGLVALCDSILGWLGGLIGLGGIKLETILGYIAWPLALAMGVPWADAYDVAQLLGERALVTEVPAYSHLAGLLAQGKLAYARSALVASYALCGFAHIGSVAIFVGGFGALVPGRMGELSRLGLKALWAAVLATVMTGCVAGIFATGGDTLLGLVK
ncbi:MAG: nucleoside transporter C-terminal domain-containing protein [Desulfarculaceae bacterium]